MIVKQYTIKRIILDQCSSVPITDKGTPANTSTIKILFINMTIPSKVYSVSLSAYASHFT